MQHKIGHFAAPAPGVKIQDRKNQTKQGSISIFSATNFFLFDLPPFIYFSLPFLNPNFIANPTFYGIGPFVNNPLLPLPIIFAAI